ncbi:MULTISPECIES: CNP1-like family protein [unclassified Nitrosospira]|uniref:CNP1-like family protein n=1 Tax=unclassified Nitrosospira TaxID=2609267 RepID=UPI000D313857|nr:MULTISPECIES: CNP1-like family protein [unclassified Nitrosospira]PTR17560.1 CNP1-like family protein [Nitrosospira sp. Nsp2]WON74126.1 CNP1-like family protein [Nitrosospira sp. Is2]
MKKILLLLCLLTLAACAAQKALKGFDTDFDGDKPWAELQVQLPAYPKAENLLPFDAGPASNNLYYIDAPSLVVGEEGIVRYTLVIKSPEGAMNVSYEGMRCATDGVREQARLKILILKFQVTEKRLYAIGRDDRTWVRARVSKWEELEDISQHYAQRALSRYFFCPANVIVRNKEEAIQALKRGSHPRVIQ